MLIYLFFAITFVIACLIIIPAFSISFRDSPVVTQTFNAGCNCHPMSLVAILRGNGILFSLAIKTPFARVCTDLLARAIKISSASRASASHANNLLHQQCLGVTAPVLLLKFVWH